MVRTAQGSRNPSGLCSLANSLTDPKFDAFHSNINDIAIPFLNMLCNLLEMGGPRVFESHALLVNWRARLNGAANGSARNSGLNEFSVMKVQPSALRFLYQCDRMNVVPEISACM